MMTILSIAMIVLGFYFLIIGSLVILNIISERRFLILTTLFCIFNMFIDFKNKNQANS
ncbi:MAG: hypothetical protein ACRCYC_01005 [Paraclostridium sp.]|uniref:hypothetical protein n=1 Tax=Paraclostridium sp. TaxID=2023273 RepID=UPI003AA3499B